jgi:hypothetical protein
MANLIFPRVSVFWNGENLTTYTGGVFTDEPLVYDVNVDLSWNNSNPTGSFKWNPSGAAFDIYQEILTRAINEVITIRFYYEGGKQIDFDFIWAGEKVVYGNDMTVTIVLKTELDGLINTDIRSTTQTNNEQPISYKSGVERLQKQFGLEKFTRLVRTTEVANKDLSKATFETLYRESETFGSGLSNLVEANGNYVFANNIDGPNLVIFTPFSRSSKYKSPPEDVLEPDNTQPFFDPAVRFGYLLGPGIVDNYERSLEWQPPQRSKSGSARRQQLVTDVKPAPGPQNDPDKNNTNVNSGNRQQASQKGAPGGSRSARPNNGIRNLKNEEGPDKQLLLQREQQCKLNAKVFLCPAFVGIKPNDILYVPSLKEGATYVEDWIVENIGYEQTAGGVEVSIAATRVFGKEGLMNPTAGAKFQEKAATLNQEGRAGLEAWRAYAWDLPFNKTASLNPPTPAPSTPETPGFRPARGGDFVDL